MNLSEIQLRTFCYEIEPITKALDRLRKSNNKNDDFTTLQEEFDLTPYFREEGHLTWVVWKNKKLHSIFSIDLTTDPVCEGSGTLLLKKNGYFLHKVSKIDKFFIQQILNRLSCILETETKKQIHIDHFYKYL